VKDDDLKIIVKGNCIQNTSQASFERAKISLKEEGSFWRLRSRKKGQEKVEDPLPGPSFLFLLIGWIKIKSYYLPSCIFGRQAFL
jgi:hypothetical protein